MATETRAILSPASCRPFNDFRSRLPFPLHAYPCHLRLLPNALAFRGVASKLVALAEAHRHKSCPWKARAIEASASSNSTPCDNFTLLRWLALLLYRALLVGGVSLSLGQVAAVHAATAPTPSVSETITNDACNGKKGAVEKDGQEAKQKEAVIAFGDEFWKGLDLARGSDELILKQILDSDPSNLSALECLAKTLMDDDNLSHALLVLDKLEGLQPNELEWKLMKAEAYDLHGKSDLAKRMFEDILKVDPFSSRALQGLILAMDQLDQGDSAMKILEDTCNKAKQANNFTEARNFGMLIGQVHMFKGRMQEALQHYKKMIDEDPNDFRPYFSQGIIYCVTGQIEKADGSFQIFDKLCPGDLEGKEALDGLKERARKEGQKIYEHKQKQKAKSEKKGGKNRSR